MKIVVSTLNAKFIHTCLALRYLKASAAPDYDVQMAEYTIKDPIMNIVSDLHSMKADVIGFSCYIWNIEETIPVIEMLKKVNPSLTIVLGGPEVSYDVYEWLDRIPQADYIVMGEGEVTFKELLKSIETGESVENVKGIVYRKDGSNHINPPAPKLSLSEIPSPFRFEEDLADLGRRVTYVETSRGCPYSCQFCLSSIEVGVRYFPVDRMKEELRFLMDNGAKTIKFVDRTFNIRRNYAIDMFQFLIDEHRPGCVFQFEITADIMRPEVLEFLNREAPPGLFRFEIGIQSTNDATNELVMRKQNFEKLARTVTMVKDGGKIDQHLDLIAGLPEEDYASFRRTFNDVFSFRPEELQLGFLKMLRGTGVRLSAEKHGYLYMDHAPYEILGNNVLSFDDVIRIKQVEDVLEKYWNDHRMDATIEYLVTEVFQSPFDFFQGFGSHWEGKGWSRIGHQLEDLFRRLADFIEKHAPAHHERVTSLMKIDYLSKSKKKPRTVWWRDRLEKEEENALLKLVNEQPALLGEDYQALNLSERDLYKHTVIDLLPSSKDGQIQKTILLVYYHPKTNERNVFYGVLPSEFSVAL
ncbi:B12-binding domain-containing radical SAM protein [Guptibacillus hwajinpoensis]|uniref:B12-binding domain-containing radical SAM protein n=1 Tax=Guptibacillus hwajinpoensis TaxID=208199 RepID=UPI001CFF0A4B|nr:B12-binding domain-containing radical SAM protein [Pseudalkalibacillus hwajinpoensis]WLR57861.1 B12-binding domain-containing radical SAM protein [Pseudalkalibacillus hwajinpoensis]